MRSGLQVRRDAFSWLPSSRVRLVRTTCQGQRHVCTECGVALTIVYDAQPDAVWIVAGKLAVHVLLGVCDTQSLPTRVARPLCCATCMKC